MRYSSATPQKPTIVTAEDASNRAFFEATLAQMKKPGPGGLLLLGGNDFKSLAVRHAQGAIRFDRRPSAWSHAAVIVHWDLDDPGRSVGLEVALDPVDPGLQVPERNAVTEFRLARYFDEALYPNVAVSFATFTGSEGDDRAKSIAAALANPNRDRMRFPFWDLLGRWAGFAFGASDSTNPLLDNTPLPAAAFCEYVYDAARVDLTPGATGNYCCPEVLYATMKHWRDDLEATENVRFHTFAVVRDKEGQARARLSGDFTALLGSGSSTKRARPPSSKSKGTSKGKATPKGGASKRAKKKA